MAYPYKGTKEENNKRKEHDFYSTPTETTIALVNYLGKVLNPQLDVIMEPACGEGKISEVFRTRGFKVSSSDKFTYKYPYGHWGEDFLETESTSTSWIITSPPFTLAEEFIRKSMELSKKNDHSVGVALLLKSNYWHAKSRHQLFYDFLPTAIVPLTWRPKFNETQKAPILDMIWNIWMPIALYKTLNHDAFAAYTPILKPEYI